MLMSVWIYKVTQVKTEYSRNGICDLVFLKIYFIIYECSISMQAFELEEGIRAH